MLANWKLSLWQKIQLRINGYVFLRWEKRKEWSDYHPIYLVRCKKHGLYETYPQGYEENILSCPKCLKGTLSRFP
jgi:hypothetical protein